MNAQIERIKAQNDIRALDISAATAGVIGGNAEAAMERREKLVIEVGEIVKAKEYSPLDPINTARDEEGFAELRAMASQRIGS